MTERPATCDGTLERTPDGGVIRFERHLPFPIREVWDAITNPARLAEWWLPFDADVSIELRDGGAMVLAGRSDDAPTMTFTVVRVEAPMLLEHTHADPGSLMRWELEPTESGCTLRLSHFVPNPDTAIDNCYVVGLHTSLERLLPCLRGEPIEWDWDAFAQSQTAYAELGLAASLATPADSPADSPATPPADLA